MRATTSLLVILLAGCVPAREGIEMEPVPEKEALVDVPVHADRDLDILFVIDDSCSLAQEQGALAANFPAFIDVLASLDGGLPDLHLGVVSSNLGAGPYSIAGCSGDGDDGELLVGAWSCRPLDASFVRDVSDGAGGRTRNYPGTLAGAFACNATLDHGCGLEQHLESMRRALNGSNPENAGFLRDTARLAVIFIADEDDCSTEDTRMFDSSPDEDLGPLTFRCFEFGVDCATGNEEPRAAGPRTGCFPREDSPYMYGVEEYVDFLKSLKEDESRVIVSTIAGPPEPVVVGLGDPYPTDVPHVLPSCETSMASATPAVRLVHFAEQFPGRNLFTSICNQDLSEGLALIGDAILDSFGNPCLGGRLADVDPDAPGLQYECSVSDVLDQQETVLPPCDTTTHLPCWHLVEDLASCPLTPTHRALVVERGGASVPPGTHVRARCRTE